MRSTSPGQKKDREPQPDEVVSPVQRAAVGFQREGLILDRLDQLERANQDNRNYSEQLASNTARDQGLNEMKLMQLEGRLKAVEDTTKIHANKHERSKFLFISFSRSRGRSGQNQGAFEQAGEVRAAGKTGGRRWTRGRHRAD